MKCAQCGSAVHLVDSEGAVDVGSFEEEYQCVGCNAEGIISGFAEDDPDEWLQQGEVFGE